MFYKINKQNFNNIDFIKVCMSILVVATHTDLFSIIEKEKVIQLLSYVTFTKNLYFNKYQLILLTFHNMS